MASSPPPREDFFTPEETEAFFLSKLKRYQNFDCKGLWDLFRYDFKHWTLDLLNTVDMSLLIQLRDSLLSGGVYVIPQDDTHSYADTIAFVLNESSPALWTLEAMQAVQASSIPFRSRAMLLKLGLTPVSGPVYQSASTIAPAATQPLKSPPRSTPIQNPIQYMPIPFPQQTPTPVAPSTFLAATSAFPAAQPDPAPQVNITYLIFNFSKVFPDKRKYSGTERSLDYTLQSFFEIAQSVGLPPIHYNALLPRILTRTAYDYYVINKLNVLSFDQACHHLRSYFEGFHFQISALEKWNAITLAGVVAANPDKSIGDCLTLMVDQLQEHQLSLHKDFQTPTVLHQKIHLACKTVEACHSALNGPQQQLGPFISSLQTAISNYTSLHSPTSSNQTYFTHRRYRTNRPLAPYTKYAADKPKSSLNKHCWVCRKQDCRFWRHPVNERQASRTSFNRKFSDRYPDNRTPDHIDKHFRQYISSCDGPDSPDGIAEDEAEYPLNLDPKSHPNQAVANLSVSVEDDDEVKYTAPQSSENYLTTSFGPLSPTNAIFTHDNLKNRIFSHRLTADAPPDIPTATPITAPLAAADASDQDLLDSDATYQSAPASRYNSTQFHGIMIDTGASNRSKRDIPGDLD